MGAIAVAASALLAIVAFAPVAGLLKTGGGDDAGDLSFAESATTTSRQANTDGSTMATTSADATELATMTTLVTDAATAGEGGLRNHGGRGDDRAGRPTAPQRRRRSRAAEE